MMTVALKNLLDAIRSKEAPKGYGQIYSGAKGVSLRTDVSILKLKDVQALQRAMIRAGSASSACGGYQFIRKTLDVTIDEMDLSGDEVWTPELQDRMAVHLLQKRRLKDYLDGTITAVQFANNLAKEWASLPVVSAIKGAHRDLVPGQSYHAGDGLNKAHHDPKVILTLVEALRRPATAPPSAQPPVSPPGAQTPRTGFWAWLKSMFS